MSSKAELFARLKREIPQAAEFAVEWAKAYGKLAGVEFDRKTECYPFKPKIHAVRVER